MPLDAFDFQMQDCLVIWGMVQKKEYFEHCTLLNSRKIHMIYWKIHDSLGLFHVNFSMSEMNVSIFIKLWD